MRKNRRRSSGWFWFLFLFLFAADTGVAANVSLAAALITAGVLIAAGVGIGLFISNRRNKKAAALEAAAKQAQEAEEAAKKAAGENKAADKYSPEVRAIISDGRLAMKELGRLYGSIQNPDIRSKINELMSVSDRIVRDAIADPTDVPQIRKFLDYYLPTTIKLLNTYDRMSVQGVSGENITGSMERIEDMLDTTIEAYKKQLDALFANQAADIQMDIETMNGMLAREGLGGKSYLDLKEFMKQYEKQQQYAKENDTEQKGSTANG